VYRLKFGSDILARFGHGEQVVRKFCRQFLPIALFITRLGAQTATLHGQVSDESGALVPGAKVTLSTAGAAPRTTAADDKGAYFFVNVAPGKYAVQSSAPQLTQGEAIQITLAAGTRTLNLTLKVTSVSEKVTVRESAPVLSTDSASNASAVVLQGSDLDALSDDPDDLAADLQALAGPSAGPNGGSIYVDGFSGGQLPAKESIREIRINQNPFSPEYDKLGYGKIEIFTKPGADKYRGSAQWNFANDFWNTRNPYAPEKAYFLLNEFEGSAGGPLTSKSSFTLDAQRNMVDNGSIANAVTVNPQSFATQPYSAVVVTPGRYTNVSPRIDYQLNDKNTLMFRYGITHSDVQDAGIGAFDLASRAYHAQFTNQTVQRVAGDRQQFRPDGDGAAIIQLRRGERWPDGRRAKQLRAAKLHLRAEGLALLAIRCAPTRTDRLQHLAAEFQWHVHLRRRSSGAGARLRKSAGFRWAARAHHVD
jgi:hypothetical protein